MVCGSAVKSPALKIWPATVVSVIFHVRTFTGTIAVTLFAVTDGSGPASIPLKLTFVVVSRSSPLIVTESPGLPLPGEKLLITGAMTSKIDALVVVETGVVSVILLSGAPGDRGGHGGVVDKRERRRHPALLAF